MSEPTGKNSGGKILIAAILIAAVIGVMTVKNRNKQEAAGSNPPDTGSVVHSGADGNPAGEAVAGNIPMLIDLGSKSCIPCKMMEPVLEELTAEYAERLKVVFIDVWKDQQAGTKYGIRVIPTQIFYAADGKELFRHEGFMSKDDILGKWKELGVDLSPKAPAATGTDKTPDTKETAAPATPAVGNA